MIIAKEKPAQEELKGLAQAFGVGYVDFVWACREFHMANENRAREAAWEIRRSRRERGLCLSSS